MADEALNGDILFRAFCYIGCMASDFLQKMIAENINQLWRFYETSDIKYPFSAWL